MDDYLDQAIAEMMHEELLYARLDVVLVPSTIDYQPTSRKRRIVEERNPDWYRRLCREWPANRAKPRKKNTGTRALNAVTCCVRFGTGARPLRQRVRAAPATVCGDGGTSIYQDQSGISVAEEDAQ